jgi:hypothetical protein
MDQSVPSASTGRYHHPLQASSCKLSHTRALGTTASIGSTLWKVLESTLKRLFWAIDYLRGFTWVESVLPKLDLALTKKMLDLLLEDSLCMALFF